MFCAKDLNDLNNVLSPRWFKDGAEITRETARRFGGEYGFRGRWTLAVPNASPDADSGDYRGPIQ